MVSESDHDPKPHTELSVASSARHVRWLCWSRQWGPGQPGTGNGVGQRPALERASAGWSTRRCRTNEGSATATNPPPRERDRSSPHPGHSASSDRGRRRTPRSDQLAPATPWSGLDRQRTRRRELKSDWQLSGKRRLAALGHATGRIRTRPDLRFVVEPPAGIEPATPSLPSMRRRFTMSHATSCPHTSAQVKGAAKGWIVWRCEVTCSAASGKSLARRLRGRCASDGEGYTRAWVRCLSLS
jgi:hypothetical protein